VHSESKADTKRVFLYEVLNLGTPRTPRSIARYHALHRHDCEAGPLNPQPPRLRAERLASQDGKAGKRGFLS